VTEVFVTPAAAVRDRDVLRVADGSDVRITMVAEQVAAALSDTTTPQGIVAVVNRPAVDDIVRLAARRPQLVVVLAQVADPGNLGTIVRTADAAGADGVVLSPGSVDPYNSKCLRASAGSVLHVPLVNAATADAVTTLHAAGLTVLAAVPRDGEDLDRLLDSGALAAPVAWVFGNEAHGLDEHTAATADHRVSIPIRGQAESLNLAAAAAICIYSSVRASRVTEQ
jgi:TrmH family RNA methyltransferase